MRNLIKSLLDTTNTDVANVTLDSIEKAMLQNGFPKALIEEITLFFKNRIDLYGEEIFQEWFGNLHFSLPEEFQGEREANQFYHRYSSWIEKELKKLEAETGITWQKQSEDLGHISDGARKTQLVFRHRITEVYYDLTN